MGFSIILNQILVMYILMAVGYIMMKKNWLDNEGSHQISNILLRVVTLVVIINAFNIEFSLIKLQKLIVIFVLAMIVLGIGFIVARLLLNDKNKLEQSTASFPNVGFFGIPLVQGLLGTEAVFYLTMVIVAYNIYSWSYGVYLISGSKDYIKIKKILKTPAFTGLWVGFIIFVSPLTLPTPITESLRIVASINIPLAMFVLGSYIAETSFQSIFKEKIIYKTCLIRLIIIPLIILAFLKLIPNNLETLKMVLLIASSAPSGVAMAMFAQKFEADYSYGAKIISLSTIFSIISIPIVLLLATRLW